MIELIESPCVLVTASEGLQGGAEPVQSVGGQTTPPGPVSYQSQTADVTSTNAHAPLTHYTHTHTEACTLSLALYRYIQQ